MAYGARMSETDRRETMQREKGRGLVRALHLSELQAAGAARELALHTAEQQLDRIAKVLPDALGAGLSMSEIARVTGVSRPTLYELRDRYDNRNLWLAVFQTVARLGRTRCSAIAALLGRSNEEVDAVLQSLLESDLLVEDHNLDEDDPALEYWLTPGGFDALEAYTFEDSVDEQEP